MTLVMQEFEGFARPLSIEIIQSSRWNRARALSRPAIVNDRQRTISHRSMLSRI